MNELNKSINEALMAMLIIESEIESEASEIRERFFEQRQSLQQEAQSMEDANAQILNKRPVRIFSPLNISIRLDKGSLRIYWHTVHFHRVTKRKNYKYIAMNKNGAYDLRTLRSKANDFEWELVKETEDMAAATREKWKKLIQSRTAILRLKELSK